MWTPDEEETISAYRTSGYQNTTWFYCSHSSWIETGTRRVYCKFCNHSGYLDQGKVIWDEKKTEEETLDR